MVVQDELLHRHNHSNFSIGELISVKNAHFDRCELTIVGCLCRFSVWPEKATIMDHIFDQWVQRNKADSLKMFSLCFKSDSVFD